jgi:hypothetical protein
MSLTKQQLKQIIEEEFVNLINEEEIDEKLFDKLKSFGNKFKDLFTRGVTSSGTDIAKSSGRRFARYKYEPNKDDEKSDQSDINKSGTEQPSTSKKSAMVRAVSQGIEPTDTVDAGPEPVSPETGTATARVEPRMALPSGPKPDKSPDKISGELPPAENIPLQLPAPKKVGIIKDYGNLMYSTEEEDFNLLSTSCIDRFKENEYYIRLPDQQKKSSLENVNTVLKHLVATKRIIQNSTIAPIQEDDRPTPSMQQIGQVDFNSWYVKSLINTTKKFYGSSIPQEIITFVILFLFKQGRLAISQRLFNKLIHTNDPRITSDLPQETNDNKETDLQQETKSYKSFYNNWKRYIQTGVKI